MGKVSLYGSIILIASFLLFLGEGGLHWKHAISKIITLGFIILVIYLIRKFYDMIGKLK
jgi:hypothetical protein